MCALKSLSDSASPKAKLKGVGDVSQGLAGCPPPRRFSNINSCLWAPLMRNEYEYDQEGLKQICKKQSTNAQFASDKLALKMPTIGAKTPKIREGFK